MENSNSEREISTEIPAFLGECRQGAQESLTKRNAVLAGFQKRTPFSGGIELVEWIECYGCGNVKACRERARCHRYAGVGSER